MKNGKWRMENGMCRKMKDSGVEWLGEVPEGWKVSKMRGFLCNVSTKNHPDAEVLSLYRDLGVVPKKSRDDNHNVTGEDTSQYKYVCAGDLVINKMKAWQGSLAVSDYEGIVSPAYYVCRFQGETVCSRFVHYLLRNVRYAQEFERLSTGMRVGQWDLGIDDFLRVPAVLAPLPEQRKIATFLDRVCAKIDEIIAGTKQTIEEYKSWKASLIFEAVTGKCRIENGKCRMGGRKMRDSGIPWLGEVPEGWVVKRLKYVVEIRSDSGEYSPESGHYIGLENIVSSGGYVETDTKYEQAIYARCRKGDLLYSKLRPYLAKCILSPLDAFCTGEFLVVSRYDGPMEFLRYWFLSANVTEAINASTYGSKMPRANEGFILNLPYLCPPVSVQQEIVSFLNKKCAAIDRVIAEKEALIADLEAYRKSLIFEVVTGKRSVGENGLVA